MSIRKPLILLLVSFLFAGPGAAQTIGPVPMCLDTSRDVDPRRSLFVTELDVVQQAISIQDVFEKFAADVGDSGVTPRRLWAQWWDTQNLGPGLGFGSNCDDAVNSDGAPVIHGFPIQCPRNEGTETRVDPFTPGTESFYEPIALVNRFDLAPLDGANCGEYRVVFARQSGVSDFGNRNLVIFEAVLPNPEPRCGLEGCRMVARFWKNLSRIDDPARRAAALRRFYLEGFPSRGIAPVIHAKHFGPGSGQIRTNQFMEGSEPRLWQLREFKLTQLCEGDPSLCSLQFVPVTVKGNPFGGLFDSTTGDHRTRSFQRHYMTQVENLSAADVNEFFARVPDLYNSGQSNAQGTENDYPVHFAQSPRFERALERRLRFLGIRLRPDHLVRRSMALSCAGCHQLSNGSPNNDLGGGVEWPPSLGFVHVTEQFTETIDGSEHFGISPALEQVFIPHREEVFENYLDDVSCSDCRSVALEPGGPEELVPVLIATEDGVPVEDVSEKVRAADADLKAGAEEETLGGLRLVH